MFVCVVCLTDIRQSLAAPSPPSGSEKPPSLSELLSTMNNSLTNRLKMTLNNLKVCAVSQTLQLVWTMISLLQPRTLISQNFSISYTAKSEVQYFFDEIQSPLIEVKEIATEISFPHIKLHKKKSTCCFVLSDVHRKWRDICCQTLLSRSVLFWWRQRRAGSGVCSSRDTVS